MEANLNWIQQMKYLVGGWVAYLVFMSCAEQFCTNNNLEKDSSMRNWSSKSGLVKRHTNRGVVQLILIDMKYFSWIKEHHSFQTHLNLNREWVCNWLNISRIMAKGSSRVSHWTEGSVSLLTWWSTYKYFYIFELKERSTSIKEEEKKTKNKKQKTKRGYKI